MIQVTLWKDAQKGALLSLGGAALAIRVAVVETGRLRLRKSATTVLY